MKTPGLATVAQVSGYAEIIDVRTPAEFAEDHIPGAINCPVLSDAERVEVGTLYKQVSPFAAKQRGAALIARNIAGLLETQFADKPLNWRPLVYCWRGGQRSGALQIVLRQVGWKADKLEGGYKAWRQQVRQDLETLPERLCLHVLTGPTGSAKTHILQAISAQGGQVLDLEGLAAHKGSVLGVLPEQAQPSQRTFETWLWQVLQGLNPDAPVFVEAESRRIGRLHLPDALIRAMRQGRCLEVQASPEARVAFLLQDYAYFLEHPEWLEERLQGLQQVISREVLTIWLEMVRRGMWPELTRQLLEQHYDPLYRRSRGRHYEQPPSLGVFASNDLSPVGISTLATQILALAGEPRPES